MKKIRFLLCASILALSIQSCVVYKEHKITDNPVGDKVGVSKSNIFNGGDFTLEKAAKNGNIDKIATVDIVTKNYLLLFNRTTVTVTGK